MGKTMRAIKLAIYQTKKVTAMTFTRALNCLYYFFGVFYRIYLTSKTSLVLYKNFGRKVDKKVVIVGGGFAGSKIAKEVENYFTQVYLIDTKDFFEFTPSILRTLIDPTHINKIQFPHLSYLTSTKYIKAKLTNISENFVYLTQLDSESPSSLPYDYLVLCTGSSYSEALFHPPFKVEVPKEGENEVKYQLQKEESFVFNTNRASEIANCCKKIDEIDKILIIGGGTVAIELAGEILSKCSEKDVTIVHSGPDLLHRYPPSVARHARSFLASFPNTHVITDDRISHLPQSQDGRGKIKTDKGVIIETEIVFICTGIQPNSSYLHAKEHPIEESPNDDSSDRFIVDEAHREFRDDRGFLKVNPYLQLTGKENIFVCGDVADTKEEKLAQSAQNSADVVIMNLIHSINHRNLIEYNQEKSLPIVISLGDVDAVFVWRNLVFTGFIPALMKSFVEFKVLIAYFPPLLSFFRRR